PITRSLQRPASQLAIAMAHDRHRLRGCEDVLVAGPCVIAMAMRDGGAGDRPRRIDVEIAGFAIEPGWSHPQPVFRPRRKVRHGCDIGAGPEDVSFAQPSSAEIGRATLSSGWRSALTPIRTSTTAAPTINTAPKRQPRKTSPRSPLPTSTPNRPGHAPPPIAVPTAQKNAIAS